MTYYTGPGDFGPPDHTEPEDCAWRHLCGNQAETYLTHTPVCYACYAEYHDEWHHKIQHVDPRDEWERADTEPAPAPGMEE